MAEPFGTGLTPLERTDRLSGNTGAGEALVDGRGQNRMRPQLEKQAMATFHKPVHGVAKPNRSANVGHPVIDVRPACLLRGTTGG